MTHEEYKMNMPIRENQQGFQTLVNNPQAAGITSSLWKDVENVFDASSDNLTNAISIFDTDAIVTAIQSRWCSEYSSESLAKQYLDAHFPLEHGSHTDVKSYVVYYHHLLAFFDNGDQSGLQNPKQFVALCGHKESPNAIVLKNGDLHTEIVINNKGKNGCNDHAGIDDVRTEHANTTVISLDKTISAVHDDGDAYASLIALLTGQLGISNKHLCSKDIAFTDVNGEDYILSALTPIVIQGSNHIKAVFA